MGAFERFLSIWVFLCIVVGVGFGATMPQFFSLIASLKYAHVNLVIAAFIWLMIFPMMLNVNFGAIKDVGKQPKGLCVTLVVNWFIKPFTMAALGILFFEVLFADWVSAENAKQYIAGMILLGIAPCTAMVFVWSQLVKGNANYTLVQVSINDVIMVFAFAPLAAILLGITEVIVPWQTLILSVVLYVLVPLLAGFFVRRTIEQKAGSARVSEIINTVKPLSIFGLLATVVILFGMQAQTIISQPLIIALLAIPLIIQSYGVFFVAYAWCFFWKVPFNIAAPAALIGTSNFFELAVAVAISVFGLHSGAALATVVGVLVEVPVMLSLVAFANATRHRFKN